MGKPVPSDRRTQAVLLLYAGHNDGEILDREQHQPWHPAAREAQITYCRKVLARLGA